MISQSEPLVALRQPEWLAGDAVIKVNGEVKDVTAENGFFVLEGLKAGDEISYTMPMQVEIESMVQQRELCSVQIWPGCTCRRA